jgi:HlyD family secretion protein
MEYKSCRKSHDDRKEGIKKMKTAVKDKTQDADLAEILSAGKRSTTRKVLRWFLLLVVFALILISYFIWHAKTSQPKIQYHSEEVKRGTITVTVAATGNVQPTNQVDVGSELSGTVESVFVDDNDHVRKGQELARLDLSKLQDQIVKSQAALTDSKAKVSQSQATVQESKANSDRLQRVLQLSGGKVPSTAELDSAKAALDRANADEISARASVNEAIAQLKSDQTNLSKGTIRSPIDGVVLTRNVEPGQTVAASLQAPVLFTLAENLAQMELEVEVDEADVGQVRNGQPATFTVDAYPNRRYGATVTLVSYGSKTTEGVVSYPTRLSVNNDDLSLRPGMTATAQIKTALREDVLLVPNAALRFTPISASPATAPGNDGGTLIQKLMPRAPRGLGGRNRQNPGASSKKNRNQQVWTLKDGKPVPISIEIGLSDGHMTEVTGGQLKEDMQIITESLSGQK